MSNNYKVHNLPDYFKQYKNPLKTLKNSGTKLQMKTSYGTKGGVKYLSMIWRKPTSNGLKMQN